MPFFESHEDDGCNAICCKMKRTLVKDLLCLFGSNWDIWVWSIFILMICGTPHISISSWQIIPFNIMHLGRHAKLSIAILGASVILGKRDVPSSCGLPFITKAIMFHSFIPKFRLRGRDTWLVTHVIGVLLT